MGESEEAGEVGRLGYERCPDCGASGVSCMASEIRACGTDRPLSEPGGLPLRASTSSSTTWDIIGWPGIHPIHYFAATCMALECPYKGIVVLQEHRYDNNKAEQEVVYARFNYVSSQSSSSDPRGRRKAYSLKPDPARAQVPHTCISTLRRRPVTFSSVRSAGATTGSGHAKPA